MKLEQGVAKLELRQMHATKMFVLLGVGTNANMLWEKNQISRLTYTQVIKHFLSPDLNSRGDFNLENDPETRGYEFRSSCCNQYYNIQA